MEKGKGMIAVLAPITQSITSALQLKGEIQAPVSKLDFEFPTKEMSFSGQLALTLRSQCVLNEGNNIGKEEVVSQQSIPDLYCQQHN